METTEVFRMCVTYFDVRINDLLDILLNTQAFHPEIDNYVKDREVRYARMKFDGCNTQLVTAKLQTSVSE